MARGRTIHPAVVELVDFFEQVVAELARCVKREDALKRELGL
jgi:hypothetical protein